MKRRLQKYLVSLLYTNCKLPWSHFGDHIYYSEVVAFSGSVMVDNYVDYFRSFSGEKTVDYAFALSCNLNQTFS